MNQRIAASLVLVPLVLVSAHQETSAQSQRQQRHRVPADYMSFRGAEWLERDERVVEERPEQVLDAMGLEAGDIVADVGCGSGYYARRIAPRVHPGGRVYCEDIQPEMLEIMETRASGTDVSASRIVPVLGTSTDTKLPDGVVDWIIMADVYHEMSEPEAMLASIRRALAPGGRVALLEYRVEDGTGDRIKADHAMSVRQVLAEWKDAGFELVALHEFLPSQHLFFFRVAGGLSVDDVLVDYDLFAAVDDGLVEVQASGAGETAVTWRVRRRQARDMVITAPVATYFTAGRGMGDMIARRDTWVVLTDDEWQARPVRALGRHRGRDAPGPEDRLDILPPETAPTLDGLMQAIQVGTYTVASSPTLYPPRTVGMEQAAIWLADGDVDYRTIADTLDDTPIPRQYAIAFALVFCDLAGVDVSARLIWEDREEVFGNLRDQGLNTWYQLKHAAVR